MASPLPDPVPLLQRPTRVLVTKLRHHGDVLLASPVFTALKRAAAEARDRRAGVSWKPRRCSRTIPRSPACTRSTATGRSGASSTQLRERVDAAAPAARAPLRSARASHRASARPDARAPAASALRRSPASARSGARCCGGAHFTHFYRLPARTERHVVEQNLDALRRIGIVSGRGGPAPGAGPGRRRAAARSRHCSRSTASRPREFVQVHPGSRWLFKCWPAERTAALLERIVAAGLRASSSPARPTNASARSSRRDAGRAAPRPPARASST